MSGHVDTPDHEPEMVDVECPRCGRTWRVIAGMAPPAMYACPVCRWPAARPEGDAA
jgi:predicted RNA-binding Zn-ribbon protein involved in translation (DUF1610 family)